MDSIPNETFRKGLLELFNEAYDGPNHSYTWFIDNAPKSGLLGTLEDISSEEASRVFTRNGSTIAAHTEHLRCSLIIMNAFVCGEHPKVKWSESWSVNTVDATTWQNLRTQLHENFLALYQALQQPSDFSDEEMFTSILAVVPHAAYHLGAIRQMKKMLKENA